MTVPYYVSEDESDMRGIKPGCYAILLPTSGVEGGGQDVQPKPPFKG